ncbi:hypothetical protein [Humisphaera borealis]|uniref:DUF1559 domain-containing protein n=1 Tax=Humisphaera borealis TaxID=2807512 RepID=A0A7M2WQ71_9BACT|nr:hypothetical protein [Humisphaera borealis]QOV87404.1 hypothetical protein IPV69_14000 [Humisphaera borealis]
MTQQLDYALPGQNASSKSPWWSWLFLLLAFGLLLVLVLPFGNRGRASEGSNRLKCASNLRQIGIACLSYANGNAYKLPDSFAALYVAGQIDPESCLCPSSNDLRAAGGDNTQIHTKLATSPPPGSTSGGYLSYHYAGKGLTPSSPATAVIAYEPLVNHTGEGGHVLYLDGQVRWKDAKSLSKIIAALNAGQNPPP